MNVNSQVCNTNPLYPFSFIYKIGGPDFKDLEYFTIATNLPGLALAEVSSPFRQKQEWMPGDRLMYDALNFRFVVDLNMKNYFQIYNWILQLETSNTPIRYDLTLLIYNTQNIVSNQIRFVDSFPTMISPIDFDVQVDNPEPATADATFRYSRYELM
jgi:hypothetical protein